MDAAYSAFFHYREATKHLPQLSAEQQILTLKYELFHALQRGNDFQDRSRALEARVAKLEAPASEREAVLDAFAQQLHRELEQARAAQVDRNAEIRRLRLALRAAETHCELLDELCRDLVATLERAAYEACEVSPEPTVTASDETTAAAAP